MVGRLRQLPTWALTALALGVLALGMVLYLSYDETRFHGSRDDEFYSEARDRVNKGCGSRIDEIHYEEVEENSFGTYTTVVFEYGLAATYAEPIDRQSFWQYQCSGEDAQVSED